MELSINNVTKQFKVKKAVDDISFSMKNGVYGLLGVNGAGKTTLMRMLCTLTTPDCGMITWDGKDIFKMGASYRQILGYLPQDFGYYPYLTIYDYMMYIASIKGIRPAVAKKRTKELLKQVGLSDQKKQKMRNLSGGMVRRVGIAQAMLNDPKILIFPRDHLDLHLRVLLPEFQDRSRHSVDSCVPAADHHDRSSFFRLRKSHLAALDLPFHGGRQKFLIRKVWLRKFHIDRITHDHVTCI